MINFYLFRHKMEDHNYILAEIYIKKDDIDKDIKIINSYGNYKREMGNEMEKYINQLVEEFGTKTEKDQDEKKEK